MMSGIEMIFYSVSFNQIEFFFKPAGELTSKLLPLREPLFYKVISRDIRFYILQFFKVKKSGAVIQNGVMKR